MVLEKKNAFLLLLQEDCISGKSYFFGFDLFLFFCLIEEIVILIKLAKSIFRAAHKTTGDTFHKAMYSIKECF